MPSFDLWRVNTADRAYCVVANGTALILQHVRGQQPRVEIRLSTIQDSCFEDATLAGKITGLLGVLHLAQVDSAAHVGSLDKGQDISRIQTVSFHCLSARQYDAFQYDLTSSDSNPQALLEPPYAGIAKILTNGQFYYSSNFDLSSRLEMRAKRANTETSSFNSQFLWNSYMIDCLLNFRTHLTTAERTIMDNCQFLVMAIQGYCGVYETMTNDSAGSSPLTLAVISRLGRHRAGTRFNTRGIDDDGNVANFAETETFSRANGLTFSHVQIRGSVPLFWEQQGVQPFATKLQVTRPQVASQPAFDRHFNALLEAYPRIHVMNLLGTKDQEALLTQTYESHLRQLLSADETLIPKLEMTNFDFHARARTCGLENMGDQISHENRLINASDDFGSCVISNQGEKRDELLSFQHGLFRTNCLDCLDRTNVVQDILSKLALQTFLANVQPDWTSSEYLWSIHRTLWAENGDALARIYAGTGALNTSFTRSGKRTLAGVFADVAKSANRLYQSNFADAGKQQAIDELLGNINGQQKVTVFDPLHDQMNEQLARRSAEYSSQEDATIWAGTFNLNGRPPSEDLLPWFFPDPDVEPDILVIGFQEIVQLTAGQIVATDPEKKRRWEAYITQVLASRPTAKATYVILRSEQLVGTALIIIVKTSHIPKIRNIEASTKKTGLKGMAGNKGGIGIRLDYVDSSFCFVTAHFAAGSSNVDERDHDYQTINNGLAFRRGRPISAHDNVIWIGDFNYRVALPTAEARDLAERDELDILLEHDQLKSSLLAKTAFAGYQEAPVTFRPTYKFDVGSDRYDSSEKQRTPSWTDRILYKGDTLDVRRYSRASIRLSDHRPVLAVFRVKIKIVDKQAKDKIAVELLAKLAAANPALARATAELVELPPPSDDEHSWWTSSDNTDGLVTDPILWQNSTSADPFEPKTNGIRKVPPPNA